MADVPLREDIYGGGPTVSLLRYWLSIEITREMAEKSLSVPEIAPSGSYILRRSTTSQGDYAVTVVEGRTLRSYKITDLGLGQVAVASGQAFASLEHLLEFFYDSPFPEKGSGHVPLRIMHPNLVGGAPIPRAIAQQAARSQHASSHASSHTSPGASAKLGTITRSAREQDAPAVPSSRRPDQNLKPSPVVKATAGGQSYSSAPDVEFEEEFQRGMQVGGVAPPLPSRPAPATSRPAPRPPPPIYGDDNSDLVYGEDAPRAQVIPTYGDEATDYRPPPRPAPAPPAVYGDDAIQYGDSQYNALRAEEIPTYGDEATVPMVRAGMSAYGDDGGAVHPALRGSIESPLYRGEAEVNSAPPPLPQRGGQPSSRGRPPPPPPPQDETYGDSGSQYGVNASSSLYGTS